MSYNLQQCSEQQQN